MIRSRLVRLAAPLAVVAALVAGCSTSAADEAESGVADLVALKVGGPWNGTAGKTPVLTGALGYAVHKGIADPILARHGFKYGDFVAFNNGPPVAQALTTGDLQVGVIGDTPAVQAKGSGLDVPALVIARPTSDIWFLTKVGGVTDIKDLAGKKVGLQFGSNFDKYGRAVLERAGVLADVELVNLLFADALPALQRGDIDAVPLPASTAGIWRQRADFPILSKASVDDPDLLATTVTLGSAQALAAHPDLPQAIWEATKAGGDAITADPDDYARFVAESTGAPAEVVKEENLVRFGEVPADPEGVATVRGTQEFLVSTGKIAAPFDVDSWVAGR